jgi:hypothetical protein
MKNKNKINPLPRLKAMVAITVFIIVCVTNTKAQDSKDNTIVASETMTATVTKINQKSRAITIKTDDGDVFSFIASSDVKNFAQIKKGDKITAVYAESLAYEVRKHGSPGLKTTDVAVAAAPGAKPSGAIAEQTMLTVTITAIDLKIPSVTFKGPKGNTKTIKVRDPQRLLGVKVGDVVDITYTEAIAIKVDEVTK